MARSKENLMDNLLLIAFIFPLILLENSSAKPMEIIFKKLPKSLSLDFYNKDRTYEVMKNITSKQCSLMCSYKDDCYCTTFDNSSCLMFHVWKDRVVVKKDSKAETFCKASGNTAWHKVFSFTAASRVTVRRSYFSKLMRSKSAPIGCRFSTCKEFFRSFFIDIWKKLPILRVKLDVILKGDERLTLTFDGKDTNNTSWFNPRKSITSPFEGYPDSATKQELCNMNNSFIIGKGNITNCSNFSAWMFVTESLRCVGGEPIDEFPAIYVSSRLMKLTAETVGNFSKARSLEIYVKFG